VFNKQGVLNKRRITPFWSQRASARRVMVKNPSCGVVEPEKGAVRRAHHSLRSTPCLMDFFSITGRVNSLKTPPGSAIRIGFRAQISTELMSDSQKAPKGAFWLFITAGLRRSGCRCADGYCSGPNTSSRCLAKRSLSCVTRLPSMAETVSGQAGRFRGNTKPAMVSRKLVRS
jgi:hypothetical protein